MEAGDAGGVAQQLFPQPGGVAAVIRGGQVSSLGGGALDDVGKADAIPEQVGVVGRADGAAGQAGGGHGGPEAVAGVGEVAAGAYGTGRGVQSDEDDVQAGAEVIGQGGGVQQGGGAAAQDGVLRLLVEAGVAYAFADAVDDPARRQQRVVAAEKDAVGAGSGHGGGHGGRTVQIGQGGGVVPDIGEGGGDFGHCGVKRQAAAEVGQDDEVVGEVGGEAEEDVGGGGALAGVYVADGFGSVDDNGQVAFPKQGHQGGQQGVVGEVKALGVGVEFADAGGALAEAAGGFMDGGVAPGGVDGYERDDAVGMVGGGGQQVVVGGGGDGGVGPAVAHSESAGDAGGVHSFPQTGGVGQASAGLGEKGGVGGVPRRQFVVPFRKIGREDVAVGVDNHTDPIIVALIIALTIDPIIDPIIGPITMCSVSNRAV